MVRRVIVLALLAAAAFLIYSSRHRIAFLAGLDSNKVRIQGDWYELEAGFKTYDTYTFSDGLISRNGDDCGHYNFTSHSVLVVTIDDDTETYDVAFPDDENMEWSREVAGGQKISRAWRR